MAFSFANVAASAGSDNTVGVGGMQVHDGPELQEIQTDQLGFKGVNGDAKLRLLEKPWPSDQLPIPSASLLSVASSQGLLAAAGPDALVVCATDSVREALRDKSEEPVKSIKPLLTTSHTRLAHVAFSADESVLVVSEQSRGGIIAYRVAQLKNGQAVPALHIKTNNTGLRALVPNPAVPSAQFFAAVTTDGELLLADLANNTLVQGINGDVLAKNVSCLAWSNKGKQMVAGLADGTAVQLKPDGTVVSHLPRSTAIPEDVHVSNICWLENDSFLITYTPNNSDTSDGIPPSEYYIVTREKSNHIFQKLPEILPAFGVERVPTCHLITRLRGWKPHLDDLIILAATTATDIGMIAKSDKALSSAEPVVGAFASTSIEDDRRRAALPLSTEESLDTTPIGMALDLSAVEKVPAPILGDEELLESSGPLPNLMLLNNEGVLCSWWLIYNDSVRAKTTFSGFASLGTRHEARSAVIERMESTPIPAQPSISSNENMSVASSPFVQPSSKFGASTVSTQFGSGSGFGAKSSIGENKSSWTSTGFGGGEKASATGSTFGQSGFGQPSLGGSASPAFGSTGALGARTGGFGQSPTVAPAFGQTTFGANPNAGGTFGKTTFGANPNAGGVFGNPSTKSPFAAAGSNSGGGFAAFSSNTGFGAFGSKQNDGDSGSPFGQASAGGVFGQGTGAQSPFGKPSSVTPFTKSSVFSPGITNASKPAFGAGSSFKLGSTFKGDGSAADDLPKPTNTAGFGFGSGFSDMLAESKPVLSPTRNTEAEMDEDDEGASVSADEEVRMRGATTSEHTATVKNPPETLVTPPSTISQPKVTPAPPVSNLFGAGPLPTTTPQTATGGNQWSFDKIVSTTPKDTPAPFKTLFGTKPVYESTPAAVQRSEPIGTFDATAQTQTPPSKIKKEDDENIRITTESPSDNETVNIKRLPEPPLPPASTSKPGYQTGDTSTSSMESSKNDDDAPLPPDFLPANKSATSGATEAGLPQDDSDEGFSSEFDGSGEDVTEDISPDEEHEDDQNEGDDDNDENDTTTKSVPASPERSFKSDNNSAFATSPTDGLFTKPSLHQQSKPARPLFGEVATSGPVFPPPKPQESPRSPSPMRQLLPHDSLRPDTRSVSAPARPRTAIDQRKIEYAHSDAAAQAIQAQETMIKRERSRLDAIKQTQERTVAKETEALEDHEDIRIQQELAQPIVPSETLDSFITYQAGLEVQSNKADIPAQIERLYQDINSMVYTLGINARSLSSFLIFQQSQSPNASWPSVLRTETPLDSLNDEWFLQDIEKLHEGCTTVERGLVSMSVETVQHNLDRCHGFLTQDLLDLRNKVIAMRKSLHARTHGNSASAPLSAEQASIQHDLRKSSASVQTRLVKVEDELTVLRTRLSEVTHTTSSDRVHGPIGNSPQKKPTVEAVTNTIAKMTSMAEKKSADVDVLELQLKRLGLTNGFPGNTDELPPPSTPRRSRRVGEASTPGSGTSSVYHTPTSNMRGSTQSTPVTNGSSRKPSKIVVSVEDRTRWQAKTLKKKSVASVLRSVLEERSNKITASAST